MCKKEENLEMYRKYLDDVLNNYGGNEYSSDRFGYLLTFPISCIVGMYRYISVCEDDLKRYVYILADLKSIMAYEFNKTF